MELLNTLIDETTLAISAMCATGQNYDAGVAIADASTALLGLGQQSGLAHQEHHKATRRENDSFACDTVWIMTTIHIQSGTLETSDLYQPQPVHFISL